MFLFFHYLASVVTVFSPAKPSSDTHTPEAFKISEIFILPGTEGKS